MRPARTNKAANKYSTDGLSIIGAAIRYKEAMITRMGMISGTCGKIDKCDKSK